MLARNGIRSQKGTRRQAAPQVRQQRLGRQYSTTTGAPTTFNVEMNTLKIGVQTIVAGSKSLDAFVKEVKSYSKKPLLVSDEGVAKVGIVENVVAALKKQGITPSVFDKTQPNPAVKDVIGIANHFLTDKCDVVIGVGGGGPLDAAKGGMALVAKKRIDPSFDLTLQGPKFVDGIRNYLSSTQKDAATWKAYSEAMPAIAGIPTTAGTGSEGGKSAVITNTDGVKVVFGNPLFMPKTVALVPQFTSRLPPHLTAATGIDALFHNMEAFFVTKAAAYNDGMNDEEIKVTDDFALKGTELIVHNLPKAFIQGEDLQTRLNMQIAALYGAKAFRKGDLGGVHATAHALGSKYHIHHGTSIGRMAVPVLLYNQERITAETQEAFNKMVQIFTKAGYPTHNLADSIRRFMSPFNIPYGLGGLPVKPGDLEQLAQLAAKDPCQTNPVPLTEADYKAIFEAAGATAFKQARGY